MENFIKPFLENRAEFIKTSININDSTESSITKYLQKIIFKYDVLAEFKNVLTAVCSPQSFVVKNDVIKKIIKGLNTVLLSHEDVKTKTDVFCYVFKSFASSCKEADNIHLVQFFLVLCHIIGMNSLPEDVSDDESTSDRDFIINAKNFKKAFEVDASFSSDSFLIFKELLLCLSKTSANLNSIEVQSYNKWLQSLIKNISNSQQFQNIFMEIFYISAEIDLKLFEGNLDDIFSYIFAQQLSTDETFSQLYADFLQKTFTISAQFQRTVKFISKFLSSLKIIHTNHPKEVLLPLNVINDFSKVVSVASNQQSLSLFEVLIQNLKDCFNLILKEGLVLKSPLLFIISELLISFLKYVKLYAPSIASTTLHEIIDKMENLIKALQTFGDFLFSNKAFMLKNENIVKICLELCFYCGEIQSLINCYKDSILHPSEIKESATEYDWQCCITTEQWRKLVNYVLKSKLENCNSQCTLTVDKLGLMVILRNPAQCLIHLDGKALKQFQLANQKIRSCQLENKPLTEDSTLKIILHQLTLDINKFNLFRHLPPEDLTILISIVTAEQSETITKQIFRQLQQYDSKTESAIWLSNSAIQENSVFIMNLFFEILKNTGSHLLDVFNKKHSSKINWLCGEYFEGDSVSEEFLKSLPEKINIILKNGKKFRKYMTNYEYLTRIVEVFKLLPLPCMKEGFPQLGLGFAVVMAVLLADDETAVCLTFESISSYLFSNLDASMCFDIGMVIKYLSELSYHNERTEFVKVKVIETLVRNSVKMKYGLSQLEKMIDSDDSFKLKNPIKVLESQVLLYNELGKSWQRPKKRQSDNDLIGTCRTKLAKIISEESKELPYVEISRDNSEILLKILAIEINKAIKSNDETEIKNLMEGKFRDYFEFAMKNLKKNFDESSVMFLIIVLQSMPILRKFLADDSALKIWKVLKTQEKVNWKLFCVNATEEEFNKILDDLLRISQKFLSKTEKHSSNYFKIWTSFLEFATETKNTSCQVHLQEFFNYIHVYDSFLKDLPIKKKIYLMEFFSFCVTNMQVIATSDVVNTIIRVILEFNEESSSIEDFRSLFILEVEVASNVFFKQFDWNKSKIHLIYLMFKHLLKSLMRRCNTAEESDEGYVFELSSCAFSLEKWASLMVKREKDFARISAYFIESLISSIASVTVFPAIKIHLTNCINHFLSISDSHTVAYLMRILKPGYQQVFNSLYDQFRKYHKYSGKV